jgi:Rifampin ADP-ribosyl transferase
LIEVGFRSNDGPRNNAKYIFLAATLDPAIWGAELASGEGRERIYLVEATGEIENDPDVTDLNFQAIRQNPIAPANRFELSEK